MYIRLPARRISLKKERTPSEEAPSEKKSCEALILQEEMDRINAPAQRRRGLAAIAKGKHLPTIP